MKISFFVICVQTIKIERYHRSLKSEYIRRSCLLSLADGCRLLSLYVHHYNCERLYSAIGYISPFDKLLGNAESIFASRRDKLLFARKLRTPIASA
ncbi:MAG: transposase [Acidobacteria bacterium]|nr:transposase [Acidobacteriota bacterium]